MATQRAIVSLTANCPGLGQSLQPAKGRHMNYLAQIDPMRVVLDYVSPLRLLNLFGEGMAGDVASHLAANPAARPLGDHEHDGP